MDVTLSQIVCGHSYAKAYWCGICKRLAIGPRVHDGGYGQNFCRQYFCSTCVDYLAYSPDAVTRIGPKGEKIFVCPTEGCLQNFLPPFFRFMGEIEEGLYASLRINCLNCHRFFTPYQYPGHQLRCYGRPGNVLPSSIVNAMASGMSAKKVHYLIGYESRWKIRSINFGLLVQRDAALSLVADGVSIPIMGSSLERGYIQVVKNSDATVMLNNIATELRVPADSIDVVTLVHRSLRQCGTFERFAEGLPIDAPLTVVEQRDSINDPAYNGYWLYLYGYKRNLE